MSAVMLFVIVVVSALVFTKYLAFAGVLVVWSARRAMRLARRDPEWYGGYRTAAATLVVTLAAGAVAGGFGIAYIPKYLENRKMRQEAATRAAFLHLAGMVEEYKQKYHGYPDTIAEAITEPLPTDYWENEIEYHSWGEGIAINTEGMRGKDIKEAAAEQSPNLAAINAKDIRGKDIKGRSPKVVGFTFNNFELRSAGPDEKMGTDDDIIMRDGVFLTLQQNEICKRVMRERSKRAGVQG
jgi:hypothetical protein